MPTETLTAAEVSNLKAKLAESQAENAKLKETIAKYRRAYEAQKNALEKEQLEHLSSDRHAASLERRFSRENSKLKEAAAKEAARAAKLEAEVGLQKQRSGSGAANGKAAEDLDEEVNEARNFSRGASALAAMFEKGAIQDMEKAKHDGGFKDKEFVHEVFGQRSHA